MFDSLSDKLLTSLKKLRGQNKITEESIQEIIKEIRLSLLEADVNFQVVKVFIDQVKAKALGQSVQTSVTAAQQFVKIVHDALVEVLGSEAATLHLKSKPSVIFMVGLQGSGKTTSSSKLAQFLAQKQGRKTGLVPADIYRPAAIEQLKILGQKIDAPVFPTAEGQKPEEILAQAKRWAEQNLIDTVIIDTAGRMQVDDELMNELGRLKNIWAPDEVLLVADAMLGQQSVEVAKGFHQKLGLTGLILTKIDGDARGGAALSIRHAVGIPIKFLGTGEKPDAFEIFHPDRLASRILDMGDIVSLVEKAQGVFDEKTAMESAKKMAKNQFTVEDFLEQLQGLKKLGGMESILKMMPGMGQAMKQVKDMAPPDKEIKKIEAIIRSMTTKERQNHKILNGSRRLRIAKGSGTQVSDVNKFVKQFEESQKMMSQMMKMGMGKFAKGMPKLPFR